MFKKMIGRILLSVVMMFTILFQGIGFDVRAAGTPREVPTKITSFKITNEEKQDVNSIWYTDSFYLAMDWDASGNGTNLKAGDYFDITLPDKMKFAYDTKSASDFDIKGPDGVTVIARAHITPGPGKLGGKVRVTFNNWVEGKENVKGNIYITSKFDFNKLNKYVKNKFDITVSGKVYSTEIIMDAKKPLPNDELVAKWGQDALKWENNKNVVIPNQAEWWIRVNYAQANMHDVVLSDHLTGGAGDETYIPESFVLREVEYSNLGDETGPGKVVNLAGKLEIAPDKRSFKIKLGDVNGKQYRLVYRTTYTPGTKLFNNINLKASEGQDATTRGHHISQESGGTGTGDLANKIKLVKKDADDNSIVLKNAVFEVTKPDGSKFELTTGADGTITSSPLVSGTYKIKEKTAPAGYKLNTDEYTLVVSPTSNAIQTVKDEPIRTSVKATKQWVGPIGSAVTVHLYADDVDTGKTVTLNAANNWEDTFTNLRKYKPGTTTEIKYTVKEDTIANYNGVVSGDMATGFTITNTNTEKTTVKVTKAWVGTPAASVTIKLLADGAEKETVTLTATENWTHTFTNLDKYAADGHEIAYTVDETPVAGYTKAISGTAATGFTITNTITAKVSVPVTKVWVGPAAPSVTIKLLADGVEKDSVTLNAANGWAHTFTNLDKYKNGTEIVYTVQEEPVTNYDSAVTGDATTGFKVTNTNTEKTSVKVTKAWVGTPAASATVKLLADGAEKETVSLTAADNWTHTFSNLPKYDANDGHEIVYTIDEVDIANYVKAITGSAATGFVVTNTITGKLDIPVTKTWLGTPAASVTIKLYADGTEKDTVTLTATDNWTHTFTNLDKYATDGHEIAYTVDETPVAGYTKAISGTAATGFTITNTNTETINIPVTKTWVGTAATSATVKLYADGTEKETVTLTAADNWTHTFSNLPKFDTTDGHEIVYTVDEVDVPNYTKGISGTAATGFTITNTITGKVSVPVTKVWVGPQASSAKVTLFADGVEKDSVTLNAANGWAHTFTNLDKYNNGTEIVYTVSEEPIANYDSVVTGDATNGFTVTNTNTEKTSVDVTKTWVGTPAASVTIKLFADGVEKDTVTLTAADNWTHTFANLDKYAADGHEIVYTVDETPITDYTKAITGDAANGFTITNTITGKVNIPVTKVWVGPEASSAKVTLYADGVEKDSVTLNAANNWVHVFANLDKYNNGTEIVYTLTEEPVANYDSTISGDAATGFTVTNTNTEKVSVDVTKNWVGPATDSITIKLLADGAEVESAVITAADNWMHTFSNLPKYAADGHEIVYTVDEYDVPSYIKAIEGTSSTGFTVTNTITGKLDIPVKKVWVGPAIDSVTVNLYADGVKVDTVQLTAADQWEHTFTNLDKYENGREIVYTVDEVLVPGYKTKITGDAQTGFTITNSKETPKTADHVNPMAYASIFVISLMAAIITMIEKKKFAR